MSEIKNPKVAILAAIQFNGLINKTTKKPMDSFQLVPCSSDAPFVRAVYDPSIQTLVVQLKQTQEQFEEMYKKDEFGRVIKKKTNSQYEPVIVQQKLQQFYEVRIHRLEDILKYVQIVTSEENPMFTAKQSLKAKITEVNNYEIASANN